MITKRELAKLTSAEKDTIILEQASLIKALTTQNQKQAQQISQLEKLTSKFEARITELEAELAKTKKTSKNSSIPPSKDQKPNAYSGKSGRREKSVGRTGHPRDLHPNPDETVDVQAKACPECGEALPMEAQALHVEYDKIEIPPIQPHVTRVRLYACTCHSCGIKTQAPAPVGFEEGSPFGNSVEGLLTYLRYSHHISYKRLSEISSHLFGLEISQGAIANIFQRVKGQLTKPVESILTRIQSSRIVCSDETSARVNGKNSWEWVFQNKQYAYHVIRPSRGAKVVGEVMDGHRPTYWASDLYSAQKNHGEKWQVCLAHQLRDCQYGIDEGDTTFCWKLKRVFLRAIALSKRRPELKPETCKTYRRRLERDLDKILALTPKTKVGEKLKKRYLKNRDSLFTFFEDPAIEPTNNSSERALRLSVVFRKVTNGFRSEWGCEIFSAIRSIVGTGQRMGLNPYQAIQKALNPHSDFLDLETLPA